MLVILATEVAERSRSRVWTPRVRVTPRAPADKHGLEKAEKARARGSNQPPARRLDDRQEENTTASPYETAAGKSRHGCATRSRSEKQEEQSLQHRDANQISLRHGNIHASTWISRLRGKQNSNCEVAALSGVQQRARYLIICFSIA